MNEQTAVVLIDGFERAFRDIAARLPDHFEFEIEPDYFHDLSIGTALQRRSMMRDFEARCREMGYLIAHDYPKDGKGWLYTLDRKPKPKNQLEDKRTDEIIDV